MIETVILQKSEYSSFHLWMCLLFWRISFTVIELSCCGRRDVFVVNVRQRWVFLLTQFDLDSSWAVKFQDRFWLKGMRALCVKSFDVNVVDTNARFSSSFSVWASDALLSVCRVAGHTGRISVDCVWNVITRRYNTLQSIRFIFDFSCKDVLVRIVISMWRTDRFPKKREWVVLDLSVDCWMDNGFFLELFVAVVPTSIDSFFSRHKVSQNALYMYTTNALLPVLTFNLWMITDRSRLSRKDVSFLIIISRFLVWLDTVWMLLKRKCENRITLCILTPSCHHQSGLEEGGGGGGCRVHFFRSTTVG